LSTAQKEKFWFEDEASEWQFELDVISALLTAGIGENDCPTITRWLHYCLGSAIVAALTGRHIDLPPEPELEQLVWDALWQAVEENPRKLDRAFLGAMLRQLIPHWHSSPPDRPYRESRFVGIGNWAGPLFDSIGNLYLKVIKRGREALGRLPEPTVTSIQEVARHVPPVLQTVTERVRKTYQW
jgi:hypothetical protein